MSLLSMSCYLCLDRPKTLKNVKTKDSDGIVVEKKLKCCLSEIIDFEPEIRKRICMDCLKNLKSFYEFKQKCIRINTIIKQHIIAMTCTNQPFQQTSIKQPNINERNELEDDSGEQICAADFLEVGLAENQEDIETHIIGAVVKQELQCDSLDIKDSLSEERLQNYISNTNEFVEDKEGPPLNFEFINCELTSGSEDSSKIVSNENQIQIKTVTVKKKPKKKTTLFKNYRCTICNIKFLSRDTYLNHINSAHPDVIFYECTICNLLLRSETNLKKHKKICIQYKNFQCPVCHISINGKSDFTEHAKIHPVMNDLKCKICSKLFKSTTTLIKHEKRHIGEFPCSYCSKIFLNKSEYLQHQRRHLPYLGCSKCDKVFPSKSKLLRHEKIHIQDFECEVCKKKFMMKKRLTQHMKIHLNIKTNSDCIDKKPETSVPLHECAICKKTFSNLNGLRIHEICHTEPTFKCNFCLRMFKYETSFLRHIRTTHAGEHADMSNQSNEVSCEQIKTEQSVEKENETVLISV